MVVAAVLTSSTDEYKFDQHPTMWVILIKKPQTQGFLQASNCWIEIANSVKKELFCKQFNIKSSLPRSGTWKHWDDSKRKKIPVALELL